MTLSPSYTVWKWIIQEFCCLFILSVVSKAVGHPWPLTSELNYGELPKEITYSFLNWVSALVSGEKPGNDELLLAACERQEHGQAPACSLCQDPHHNCTGPRHKHETFPSLLVSSWHALAMFAFWIISNQDTRECQEYLPHRLDMCYCCLMNP